MLPQSTDLTAGWGNAAHLPVPQSGAVCRLMPRLAARVAVTVMPGPAATWMVPGPAVTATVLRGAGRAGLDSLAAGHDGPADADPPG